ADQAGRPHAGGQPERLILAPLDLAKGAAGEDEAGVGAVDAPDDDRPADARPRLPGEPVLGVAADVFEDAGRGRRRLTVELCRRGERAAAVVEDDQVGREAL